MSDLRCGPDGTVPNSLSVIDVSLLVASGALGIVSGILQFVGGGPLLEIQGIWKALGLSADSLTNFGAGEAFSIIGAAVFAAIVISYISISNALQLAALP